MSQVRLRSRPVTVSNAQAVAFSSRRHQLDYRPPTELTASEVKLRKASKRFGEHLTQCIRRWGIVIPILVDGAGRIIAGHGIWEAAKLLQLDVVPVLCIDNLSGTEARALRIAINKIQELSTWNPPVLKDELAFLAEHDFELLTFTAFSSAETDAILNTPAGDPDDAVPDLPKVAVSRDGDLWTFAGGHRLGCSNALEGASYDALMAGEKAGLVNVDPPYNVKVRGHVSGKADAREFPMASGEMNAEAFTAFLHTYMQHLVRHSRDGALLLQWMDWRHMREMLAAGDRAGLELLNLAVWSKSNPGMGSLWRSAHELCFAWKSGTAPHCNQIELGRNGRSRSNVWNYPGANSFSSQEDRDGRGHVSAKNLAMTQDAILDVSRRGDIVLDCFAGSGTTLLAAHRAKRRGYGLELDPLYVDLAVGRLEARTGAPARHAETGLTFAETAAKRGIAPPLRAGKR